MNVDNKYPQIVNGLYSYRIWYICLKVTLFIIYSLSAAYLFQKQKRNMTDFNKRIVISNVFLHSLLILIAVINANFLSNIAKK